MTVHSERQRRKVAGNQHVLDVRVYRGMLRLPVVLHRLGLGRILPLAVLTATGRSTGLPRRTALYPHVIDGRTYLWCPYGDRAQWYRNVVANPIVTLQSRRGTQVMRAVPIRDEGEALGLITSLRRFSDSFFQAYLDGEDLTGTDEEIAKQTDRLHLLRLEPTTEPGPPALRTDLAWVWPALAAALLIVGWVLRR